MNTKCAFTPRVSQVISRLERCNSGTRSYWTYGIQRFKLKGPATRADSQARYFPTHSVRCSWNGAAIDCARISSFLDVRSFGTTAQTQKDLRHLAYIALGSNVGDRLNFIEDACKAVESQGDVKIKRTSSLWETKAMYVTDQGDFLNGVLEVETSLEAFSLLDRLQSIEKSLKRIKTIDKGPRSIDLDIILYDDLKIDTERLTIPHKLMLERAFVLQPLCDLIPMQLHPSSDDQTTIQYHKYLNQLPQGELSTSTFTPASPKTAPLRALEPKRQTQLMSILNITPDSFSDGGAITTSNETSFRETVRSHIQAGVTMIDIGGQSTRPRATPVGHDEEIRRVEPAIRMVQSVIKEESAENKVAISIDTYRARVAEVAITAGAHIVNDVSGGLLDIEMLPVVSKLGCSIILMHMRGDPSTMTHKDNTSYPNGLISTICDELMGRAKAAEAAGIRRWRIILDPGVGFAKNQRQNLEVLRRLGELRQWDGLRGIPWLVGSSRKGFIGKITEVEEPRERMWGTAAAVACAVQGGADIVRVHDPKEMGQVVKMSDAIWRRVG